MTSWQPRFVRSLLLAVVSAASIPLAGAAPAAAADEWTYQGWFSLDGATKVSDPNGGPDTVVPKTLDVYVDMRVEDGRAVASTATRITIRKPAVPLKVTARATGAAIPSRPVVLVTKVSHWKWTTTTTEVDCAGCRKRVNTRTGRVRITPGAATAQVSITVTARANRPDSLYRPHTWTRAWTIR